MDAILYVLARCAVGLLQLLPLKWVARLGRAGGELFFWIDLRHKRVALQNLENCFAHEKSPAELYALARENFRRIGENFASAVKTSSMTFERLKSIVEVVGTEKVQPFQTNKDPQSRIIAVGHFGNFEAYTQVGGWFLAFKFGTTYRGLRQPSLNRLLQSMRRRSGCLYFERRSDAKALRETLSSTGIMLGLLADQHAGDNGLWLPFLGRDCSTSAAPAVLALRYNCPLYTAICYRTALAHWRIEFGDEIPTRLNGETRSIEAITREINSEFERAVRRDPANWFWVHKRWKPRKRKVLASQAAASNPESVT